jgi:glutamyl-Q tRNA(Asp) synthetase
MIMTQPSPAHTRFAPSPTGEIHLGHAFSACFAAQAGGGQFTLRIDDIDHTRCKPAFTEQMFDDLAWLGLQWREPVRYQSDRFDVYQEALETLIDMELVYPCFLSRAEINALLSAPQDTGTVKDSMRDAIPDDERRRRENSGMAPAWRLHTSAALEKVGQLSWHDVASSEDVPIDMTDFGDVVIARKDIGTSYHLSVVIDDAMDDITLVTRAEDLKASTNLHRLLQELLGLSTPDYLHHRLLTDSNGRRLAKRDKSTSIATLRRDGHSADTILRMMPKINIPQHPF